VLLAAAYRWGFQETLANATVIVIIFLFETAVAATGLWGRTFASIPFDLNSIITRVAYLLLTGFLLGYLADQEKQFRAEMGATTDAMRQSDLGLGLGGSVAAIARLFLRIFRASGVDVVIQDHENGRTLLWHARTAPRESSAVPVRRIELDGHSSAAWLFETPSRAWCNVGPRRGENLTAVGLDPQKWALTPVYVTLPITFTDAREFSSLAMVDFGLPAEWRGRLVLFDPAKTGDIETRLHFLDALATHLTPALSNAFLLRRLRSRASAAERARVARELHDGAIQTLIGIEMETQALRRRVEAEAPAIAGAIEHIQELLRQEVIELRELMQELRPVDLDAPQQLLDVLASLVERFRRDTSVSARFVSEANTASLPQKTALEVVRIVQEALVNVRKHSRAQNVLVRLIQRADAWTLTIEDDGHGFEFRGRLTWVDLNSRLLGPVMIKERARVIGGQLSIESTPGSGARVEVTFNAP